MINGLATFPTSHGAAASLVNMIQTFSELRIGEMNTSPTDSEVNKLEDVREDLPDIGHVE
ncbi:hypothetical protein E2C01_075256 [Portunus trituberculatus]|uniref:Uncharacterized protein n=1 Tax=Portunus trituberculatus TaxID=210409 RepID=A0A5B7I823_PORTR|nr:hypothetical protein [Portunus trituberculatus]